MTSALDACSQAIVNAVERTGPAVTSVRVRGARGQRAWPSLLPPRVGSRHATQVRLAEVP